MTLQRLFLKVGHVISAIPRRRLHSIYRRYSSLTMIPEVTYVRNLLLAKKFQNVSGAIVECGVWKGGMSAGLAEVLGSNRDYYLVDSFAGCPKAREIDGHQAKRWQEDINSPFYYNNCAAEIDFCREAMKCAGASQAIVIEGWFEQSLQGLQIRGGVAILRLDADWYESTKTCLEHLFDQVNHGGLIIIDDYHHFDGCAYAIHEFLVRRRCATSIRQFEDDVCYLVKSSSSVLPLVDG